MSKTIRISWIANCGQSAKFTVPDDFKGESASEVWENGILVPGSMRTEWVDGEREFDMETLDTEKS